MQNPAVRALTLLLFALAACTEPKEGERRRDSSAGMTDEGGEGGEYVEGGQGGGKAGTGGKAGGSGTGGSGAGGAASGGTVGSGTGGGAGTGASDAGLDSGSTTECSNCGRCQECVAGKCQNQVAGSDIKNDCDGAPGTCRTGDCDGNGGCQVRAGNSCDGADLVSCSAAGAATRMACPSGQCSNNQCDACGGANQPCCGAMCNSGYMCSAGKCVTACVPGGTCGTNNMCRMGKISCDTGAPVCVTMAINEGIVCSSRKCSGTTSVVESRCGGGNCVEQTIQNCNSTQSCTGGQCKKKNGQSCSNNSECANNSCKGPRFCYQGSNGHCPCVSDGECESTDCRENTGMRTCGGGDCKDYQCNQTPPAQDTCDVHDP